MTRPRKSSGASEESGGTAPEQVGYSQDRRMRGLMLTTAQELGSMYDYLAKIILLGPSGTGKYARPHLTPVNTVAPRFCGC